MDAFFDALISNGPEAALAAENRIFEPLIGSWDLDVTWFEKGKAVRKSRGEWHFSWVLEGRAVQDVWIVPPRSDRGAGAELYEYGTSVRFYDAHLGAWRSTWIGPMRGLVLSFVARKVDGNIVLETRRDDGLRMQWMFSEVEAHRFNWRNQVEHGEDWETLQTFSATRMAGTR
jgi:hypothetical protein